MAGPRYGRFLQDVSSYLPNQGPHTLSNGTGANADAIALGAGTSASPVTSSEEKFLVHWRYRNSAPSGDVRLNYSRLYLSGGAGGECSRQFTTVEENCGTARGAHVSLNFNGGFCSGLAVAQTSTLHLPNTGTVTGNVAAHQAEIYMDAGDDDDVVVPANHGIIRASVSGDAGNVAKIKNLLHITGVDEVDGDTSVDNMITTGITALTSFTAALRIRVDDTNYYLPLATSITGDGV